MTNTRITDPEVLETRYPVRLERFEIRRGLGGRGRWPGGDGFMQQYRFLKPVVRESAEGQRAEVPEATSYTAEAGEGLIIETPGGGGGGLPL